MALRIVVEGLGTIESATRWESVARLSASGRYSFTMPASDPAAGWLTPLVRVFCYWDATLVGAGVVEYLTTSAGMLQVEGGDLSVELLYKMIRYANSTYAETIANELGALLPAGWSYVDAITGTTNIVALNVMWDSLQNAIKTLSEMAGLWWHAVGTTLTIANGYGAVVAGLTPLRVTKRVDASNVVSAVFPFGAGEGMSALTMKATNLVFLPPFARVPVTGPPPYPPAEGIANTAAVVGSRFLRLDFKNIAPPTNDDVGIVSAANTLAVAAMEHLKANATPIVEYAVEAVWAGIVRPLDQVALVYADESLRVSESLIATEITTRVTPEQLVTVGLKLEASARRILSDDEVIADGLIASRITPVYQQLGLQGETQDATTWIDLNNGVTTEGSVTFRFQPRLVQIKRVLATRAIRGVPVGLMVNASAPTSVEYRLNGTGAWATMPASLNLLSAVTNSTTEHQLSDVVTVNIRGVALTNVISPAGTPVPAGITAIPTGTMLRLVGRNALYAQYNLTASAGGGAAVVEIAIGDWVKVTGAPTYVGASYILSYPALYKGLTGWLNLYSGPPGFSGNQSSDCLYRSVDYSAYVDVRVELQGTSQAN